MDRINVHGMNTPIPVSAETIILAQMPHKRSEATDECNGASVSSSLN